MQPSLGGRASFGVRPWLGGAWGAAALLLWGAIAGSGQAPWGHWWLTLPALALALHEAAAAPRPRDAARMFALFGTGYFGWTLHWIVSPFLVEPEIHGWMAPFALIFMAIGFAAFWAGAAWVARRLTGSGLPAVWAIAASLGLAEAARALLLTGFPWALLGHVWIDTPLAQLAGYGGPFLLTGLTLALAAASAGASVHPAAAVALAVVPLGWILNPGPAEAPEAGAPIVRIVQPNVPQDEKWSGGVAAARLADLRRLSRTEPPADLIVWPETALPWPVDLAVATDLAALVEGLDSTLATGVLRWGGDAYLNALFVLAPDGRPASVYDKVHLVPFGEYIPFGELAGRYGLRGLAARDGGGFAAGMTADSIELPGIGSARALICYEGIFAEEVGLAGPRPRLILLVTNDAWFGRRAGPQQHLAQARLRAIEQGLPLVRAANTGISAMIDARGRILAELPLGRQGGLTVPLPAPRPLPPYATWGDRPALAMLVLWALAAIAIDRRSRRP